MHCFITHHQRSILVHKSAQQKICNATFPFDRLWGFHVAIASTFLQIPVTNDRGVMFPLVRKLAQIFWRLDDLWTGNDPAVANLPAFMSSSENHIRRLRNDIATIYAYQFINNNSENNANDNQGNDVDKSNIQVHMGLQPEVKLRLSDKETWQKKGKAGPDKFIVACYCVGSMSSRIACCVPYITTHIAESLLKQKFISLGLGMMQHTPEEQREIWCAVTMVANWILLMLALGVDTYFTSVKKDPCKNILWLAGFLTQPTLPDGGEPFEDLCGEPSVADTGTGLEKEKGVGKGRINHLEGRFRGGKYNYQESRLVILYQLLTQATASRAPIPVAISTPMPVPTAGCIASIASPGPAPTPSVSMCTPARLRLPTDSISCDDDDDGNNCESNSDVNRDVRNAVGGDADDSQVDEASVSTFTRKKSQATIFKSFKRAVEAANTILGAITSEDLLQHQPGITYKYTGRNQAVKGEAALWLADDIRREGEAYPITFEWDRHPGLHPPCRDQSSDDRLDCSHATGSTAAQCTFFSMPTTPAGASARTPFDNIMSSDCKENIASSRDAAGGVESQPQPQPPTDAAREAELSKSIGKRAFQPLGSLRKKPGPLWLSVITSVHSSPQVPPIHLTTANSSSSNFYTINSLGSSGSGIGATGFMSPSSQSCDSGCTTCDSTSTSSSSANTCSIGGTKGSNVYGKDSRSSSISDLSSIWVFPTDSRPNTPKRPFSAVDQAGVSDSDTDTEVDIEDIGTETETEAKTEAEAEAEGNRDRDRDRDRNRSTPRRLKQGQVSGQGLLSAPYPIQYRVDSSLNCKRFGSSVTPPITASACASSAAPSVAAATFPASVSTMAAVASQFRLDPRPGPVPSFPDCGAGIDEA